MTEGIGQGRITRNLEGLAVDHSYRIPDAEAFPLVFDLLQEEGLCMGGSTGINIAGAIRLARDLGPGHTIVTILCDYGQRYQSGLFNPRGSARQGTSCSGMARRAASGVARSLRVTGTGEGKMSTKALFRRDPYWKECEARVAACVGDEAVVLDRTVFFWWWRRAAM